MADHVLVLNEKCKILGERESYNESSDTITTGYDLKPRRERNLASTHDLIAEPCNLRMTELAT
jgi:hypothetical protein